MFTSSGIEHNTGVMLGEYLLPSRYAEPVGLSVLARHTHSSSHTPQSLLRWCAGQGPEGRQFARTGPVQIISRQTARIATTYTIAESGRPKIADGVCHPGHSARYIES